MPHNTAPNVKLRLILAKICMHMEVQFEQYWQYTCGEKVDLL